MFSIVILCVLSLTNGMTNGRAIQLVAPAEGNHERLLVQQEALAVLQSFPSDISVLAVIGPLHTGKSFLLNQLRGSSEGFALGPSVEPKTKGLWMWDRIVEKDGRKFLLLDTEGFYAPNVSSTYDAKVFSLATLMSSLVMYNSVRIIDQNALEALELLGRRAELFLMRSQELELEGHQTNAEDALSVKLPHLHWVVRDFYQELETECGEWLSRLMASTRRDSAGPHLGPTLSVDDLFPSTDCTTLGFPAFNEQSLRNLEGASISESFTRGMEELWGKTPGQLNAYSFRSHIFAYVAVGSLVNLGIKVWCIILEKRQCQQLWNF
jgi:hypothetical protein